MKEVRKIEKAEDFVGWVSPDGKLTVVSIVKKSKHTTFKLVCTECSKDPELFPDGYFISTKSNLKKGRKPCGCSTQTKWKDWQYLILARRVGEKKGFIVHGFAGEYKGNKSKIRCECIKDGYCWDAAITNLLTYKSGCKKCSNRYSPTFNEALSKCLDICKEMNYTFLDFVGEYSNVYSRFEYLCPIHGKQNVSYTKFVKSGNRCPHCARDASCFNGYFKERKDEKDFLYVLNFNNKFIKIGRSFDIEDRVSRLKNLARVPLENIYKLKIYTATHQEIYDYEQELLLKLKSLGYQYNCTWSGETMKIESLDYVYKLLTSCKFEESTSAVP